MACFTSKQLHWTVHVTNDQFLVGPFEHADHNTVDGWKSVAIKLVLLQLSPCCTHTFCAFLPHPYILALFLLTFFDHVPTQMSRVDKSMSSVSTLQAEAGRVLGEFSEKQERSLHGTYPASVIPRHFILMNCWVRSVKRLGSHAYVPSFGHTSPFHPNDLLGAFSKAPRLSCLRTQLWSHLAISS